MTYFMSHGTKTLVNQLLIPSFSFHEDVLTQVNMEHRIHENGGDVVDVGTTETW